MDKIGNGKVQCRLCQKQLTYAQGGSTTSLRLHLRSLHPSVTDAKPDQQAQRPLSAFGVGPQRPCNDSRQEKITSLLVKCLVANMLPLSLVDNAEFRELLAFMEPNYTVPCRQDAKTLEMRDEHWSLMSDLLPVLQPLQIVTELLCAEKSTSASVVYPLMYKLVNVDMAESDDDAATVRDFKRDIRKALDDRFALSSSGTARHPFVIATVLDPATKDCDLFPTAVRVAAYEHVRGLVDATASADDQTPVDNDQEESSPPPAKRAKADPRTASLKFLQASTSAASPSRAQLQEFDRYLAAPADDRARDALQWWSANAQLYPATARIARD